MAKAEANAQEQPHMDVQMEVPSAESGESYGVPGELDDSGTTGAAEEVVLVGMRALSDLETMLRRDLAAVAAFSDRGYCEGLHGVGDSGGVAVAGRIGGVLGYQPGVALALDRAWRAAEELGLRERWEEVEGLVGEFL